MKFKTLLALMLLMASAVNASQLSEYNKSLINDASGSTPLIDAVYERQFQVVKNLLEAGADPNTPDEHGYTALFIALQNGFLDIAEYLINFNGIDVNKQVATGSCPLHLAAEKGYHNIVGLLISKGALVNVPDSECQTPLDRAISAQYRTWYGPWIFSDSKRKYRKYDKTIELLRKSGGLTSIP